MRIKSLLLILLVCILLPTPAHALENIYADICPMNTEAILSVENNVPTLAVSVFNTSEYTIDAFEFSVNLLSSDTPYPSSFGAKVTGAALEAYGTNRFTWPLGGYSNLVDCRDLKITKITFSDGTVWMPRAPLYAAAYFYPLGQRAADGAYVLDNTHGLKLIDYSYSSHSRAWYIWNDAYGWMLFSRALSPVCQVWRDHAVIKLVINDNPALYTIQTFPVVPRPDAINITAYATGATASAVPSVHADSLPPADSAPAAAFTMPYAMQGVPCALGLWDLTDSKTRAWYIWDGAEWQIFSTERGPVCQIWKSGRTYIKLEYADSESVYAIDILDTMGM